jgi:hypothetical protein
VTDTPWGVDPSWNAIPPGHNIDRRDLWTVLLDGKHSVLLGELNFPALSPFNNSPEEKKWMEESLDLVRRYGLSYTVHTLSGWLEPSNDLLSNNGPLTPGAGPYPLRQRGLIIFEDLQKYPPTQFDR